MCDLCAKSLNMKVFILFLIFFLLPLSVPEVEGFETRANWIRNTGAFEPKVPGQDIQAIDTQYQYSSMHRIVLERNMVNGINLLTQAMLSKENTIYVIRDDFDLNNNHTRGVTIPSNCILQFEGGSISNGTIIGQDTEIQAGLVKIFNTDVTLEGSWKNNGHVRWFGANPQNENNTVAIQRCLDCFEVVEIDNATYKTDALNLSKCRVLKGIKSPRGELSTLSFAFNSKSKVGLTVIFNSSYPYVEIEGVSFILGNIGTQIKSSIAIDLSKSTSGGSKQYSVPIKCNGCMFRNFEIGIKSNFKSYYNYIDNCVFSKVSQCLRDFSSNNLIITKTYASFFSHFVYGVVGNGPFTLRDCSFELYTGGIVFTNVGDVGVFNFVSNYVETVKGNIFQGFCSSLVSMGNDIQVDNDVDCLYYPYNIASFISMGNIITNKDGFRVNSSTGKYDFKYYKYYNTSSSKLKIFISQDVVNHGKSFDKSRYSGEQSLPLKGDIISVSGYEPFTGKILTTGSR